MQICYTRHVNKEPTKQKCSACGNNYTPHALLYISETSGIIFTLLEEYFPNPITGWLYGISSYFEYLNFTILREVGFATYRNLVPTLGRAKVLYEEAQRRKINMRTISLFGKPLDYFVVDFPNNTTMLFRGLPKMLNGPLAAQGWLDDKYIFKRKAQTTGIAVPNGNTAWSLRAAKTIFNRLKKPVIVKPRQGSRGRHTTTWVQTEAELEIAFHSATQICACAMIEEQLQGSVYRGTVVDGEVVGILAGDQPRITGDGKSTINKLIQEKNTAKAEGIADVVLDEKLEQFLKRSGYTTETILAKGTTIDISEKIGVAYGGDARNVTDVTHPKVIEYLRKAGALVEDPIVGFDFIIPDISADPDNQHWGFIECNGLPFINLHHDARIGGSINVAGKVWDYVLREIAKKPRKKLWICL